MNRGVAVVNMCSNVLFLKFCGCMQADTTPESGNQRGGRTQRAAKDKARAAIAGTRNGAGASKNEREREQEVEELSLLTALRSLFRLLAAEQAQQAHLPLPHSVMMLLVTHLQPQCASRILNNLSSIFRVACQGPSGQHIIFNCCATHFC